MLNLQKTYTDDSKDYGLAANASVTQEGVALVSILEGGIEKVKPSEGTSNEILVGFSFGNNFVTDTLVESVSASLPAVSAKTTVQLLPYVVSNANPTAGTSVFISGSASTFAPVANAGAVSVAGNWFVDPTSGLLTIMGAASEDVVINYRRELTVNEQTILFGSPRVNAPANATLNQVTAKRGNGNIFTDQYDTSNDWSTATLAYTGADGKLTTTATGGNAMRIISRPSAADKFIGVSINLA